MTPGTVAESVAVAGSRTKHEQLFYSLLRVDQVKERLDEIIDRIQGGKPAQPLTDNVLLNQCTLVELLESASGTLDEQIDGIKSRLDDLERLLF